MMEGKRRKQERGGEGRTGKGILMHRICVRLYDRGGKARGRERREVEERKEREGSV